MVIKRGRAAVKRLVSFRGKSLKEAEKLRKAADKFHKEIRKNIVTAVTAALGFMIALVWRDAMQESINKILAYIGLTGEAYLFRIFSAILVTFIAVLGVMFVSRWAEKKEEKK